MKNIFLILFLFLIAACSQNEIDPEVMSKTYVDILVAKETFPRGSDTLAAVTNEIFEKYNISGEKYYSTLKNYETDQKKWDEFFEKSRAYLDTLKSQNKFN